MGMYIRACSYWSNLFFKQNTAYELRISDWSSDVCSSDLETVDRVLDRRAVARPRRPDCAGEQGRAVEIRRDDRVAFGVGARDRAENLRHRAFAVPRDRKSTRLNSSH